MLRGYSFHSIDPKGRIIIPARFRDVIQNDGDNSVMVTQLDGSLWGYPLKRWTEVENLIMNRPNKTESMRRFRRVFVGGASHCVCDKQDRILIPPALRQYAQLEKDIVIVGVLDHFEIWSRTHWDREHQYLAEDMKKEAVREEIAELGL